MDPKEHWKAIEEHGFKAMAPCDIMDEFGEMEIPVDKGFHLDKDIVGGHLADYDSILVLSHFKGHAMGGFGGALKNISIGMGSTHGKTYIHTAGVTTNAAELFEKLPPRSFPGVHGGRLQGGHCLQGRGKYALCQCGEPAERGL